MAVLDITVYQERFYCFLGKEEVAKREYMQGTEFHGFTVKAKTDDRKAKRFDRADASRAVKPNPGDLVVVKTGVAYSLQRYPAISGALVGTVVSLSADL